MYVGVDDNATPYVMDEEKTIYTDTSGTLFPKSCKYKVLHPPPTQVMIITIVALYIIIVSCKTVDDPPTQPELIIILVPRLSSKWLAIGLGLGLSPQQLKEVQGNRPDDRDGCLKDVLMMWEDSATDDNPYTWITMLRVLRSEKKDLLTTYSKSLSCYKLNCKLYHIIVVHSYLIFNYH